MNVIICIDDNSGLMFNNRRQSKDRAVLEQVLEAAQNSRLCVNLYTGKLFAGMISEEAGVQVIIREQPARWAEEGDYCFVEGEELAPFADKIQQLTIYRWNRVYPADIYLDLNLEEWTLTESVDFAGYSHEKITREVYRR